MVARNRAGVDTQLTTLLPDNTTREISPADLRSVLTDILDSLSTLNPDRTDASVNALIATFARTGNTDFIPDSKLDATIARLSQVARWAQASNADIIPIAKLPSAYRDAITASDGREYLVIQLVLGTPTDDRYWSAAGNLATEANAEAFPRLAVTAGEQIIVNSGHIRSTPAGIPSVRFFANATGGPEIAGGIVDNAGAGFDNRILTVPAGAGFVAISADAGAITTAARVINELPVTFVGLSDTPGTLTGQGGRHVAVNAGGTALEFVAAPTGGGSGVSTFLALTDVIPSAFPSTMMNVVADASGVRFAALPTGGGTTPTDPVPFIDGFGIQGVSRQQTAPYTLTGSQTFVFNVHNPDSITGNLTISQGAASLSTAVSKTASSMALTIMDITLAAGQSATFTISGTATAAAGGAPFSTQFTITAIAAAGFTFEWRSTDSGDSADATTWTQIADQMNGENIDFMPIVSTGDDQFEFRVPSTRRITSIQFGFGTIYANNEVADWTETVAGGFATYTRDGFRPGTFQARVIAGDA